MSIDSEFFKHKVIILDKLIPFGFVRDGEDYLYRQIFMNGDFEAIIRVTTDGEVTSQVIDTELGEVYLALRAERVTGNYVGQVRQAYLEILERVADDCCQDKLFQSPQANRLATYLSKTFGDSFDHPFEKHPNYLSFRLLGKWYALLFPLSLGKLADVSGEIAEREVDVVNIKVNPDKMSDLLDQDGIYPSYHMSKKTWVSVVLDDNLSDEYLFDLVSQSRYLVNPNTLVNVDGPDYWIIPANMKDYDIDKAFASHQIVNWKQKASIKTRDFVLIYITAPTKAVRYICKVLKDHQVFESRESMTLQLVKHLSDNRLTFEHLKSFGVKSVRGPRRITKELIQELESGIML